MKLSEEIAAVLVPLPGPDDDGEDYPPEVRAEMCAQVLRERQELAADLEASWDSPEPLDPLLISLQDARRRMLAAEAEIRLLIAYGREFTRPRPYRLADLAEACGMSISGVRTAYDRDEITAVADRIGRPARSAAIPPDPTDPTDPASPA